MGWRQPRLLGDSGLRRDVPSAYREIVCQFENGKLCASDCRKLPLWRHQTKWAQDTPKRDTKPESVGTGIWINLPSDCRRAGLDTERCQKGKIITRSSPALCMHNLDGRCISNWQGLNIVSWGNWTVSLLMEACQTWASTQSTVSDRHAAEARERRREAYRLGGRKWVRESERQVTLLFERMLRRRCHDEEKECLASSQPQGCPGRFCLLNASFGLGCHFAKQAEGEIRKTLDSLRPPRRQPHWKPSHLSYEKEVHLCYKEEKNGSKTAVTSRNCQWQGEEWTI